MNIELLAPAKDLNTGKKAINYGADAVYIGAPNFGARKSAANSVADIETLVNYAHLYNAKIFVTLNTILFENELEAAQKLATNLWNIGVDALIVQDVAFFSMNLPPIPLHASTQMHNYELERIKFIESIGCKRIILARETSLEQLREIRQHTTCELETFVHGALCVSLSGQCYMSQYAGNRSANRGECAQPCRLPYTLTDRNGNVLIKDKHLLSLRDLNLSEHLQELIDAGVCSFKIEGRLKNEEYVTNVVSYYRQKIDHILNNTPHQRASSGNTTLQFTPDIAKTFNRGYTTYFFNGRQKDITSFDTPKSKGELLGEVVFSTNEYIKINTTQEIHTGDGICFFDKNNTLVGQQVSRVSNGNIVYTDDNLLVPTHTPIYRNYDKHFFDTLKKDKSVRKIAAHIKVEDHKDGILLSIQDEDGNQVQHIFSTEKTPANNAAAALNNITTQLQKTGDSCFYINNIIINLPQPYFFPISQLNLMRRTITDMLQEERLRNYKRILRTYPTSTLPYYTNQIDYHANVANSVANQFYHQHNVSDIEPAIETQSTRTAPINVMTTKHCLRYQLNACNKHTLNKQTQKHLEEPLYLSNNTHTYKLEFDCSKCVMKLFSTNANHNINTPPKVIKK